MPDNVILEELLLLIKLIHQLILKFTTVAYLMIYCLYQEEYNVM